MLLAEEQSNFKDGVAYPISQGSTSEGDWALNAAGAYDEAKWSNDMSSCDLCGTPQEIQPACAYADKCGTSTIPPLCEWESGGDDVGGIIGGVIVGVVVCCVLGGARRPMNSRSSTRRHFRILRRLRLHPPDTMLRRLLTRMSMHRRPRILRRLHLPDTMHRRLFVRSVARANKAGFVLSAAPVLNKAVTYGLRPSPFHSSRCNGIHTSAMAGQTEIRWPCS